MNNLENNGILRSKDSNTVDSDSPARKRLKLDRSLSSHSILSDTNDSEFSAKRKSVRLTTVSEIQNEFFDNSNESTVRSLSCRYSSTNSSYALESTDGDVSYETSSCDINASNAPKKRKRSKKLSDAYYKAVMNRLNEILKPADIDRNCYFDRLSDEIVIMIFRFLPKSTLANCSSVCRRWNRLTADDSIWTKIDCSQRRLLSGDLGRILSKKVSFLRLQSSEFQEPAILPVQKFNDPAYFLRIVYLDLSMCRMSKSTLSILLSKCFRLRKLSLESCTIDEHVCRTISNTFRSLEVLNLAQTAGLTTTAITTLFSKPFLKLKELNMAWTDLTTDSVTFVCDNLPATLERFNFSGHRKFFQNHHVTTIVKNCLNLRELDLSDCTQLSNRIFAELINLKELKILALSRCYLITLNDFRCLKQIPKLRYLDLHGFRESQVQLTDEIKQTFEINKFLFSSVARPSVGLKKSTMWGVKMY